MMKRSNFKALPIERSKKEFFFIWICLEKELNDDHKRGFIVVFIDNMEWLEGIGILVAVCIVVLVAALVDYKKERQFRGLQDKVEKDHLASVVRDNHIQQIPISDLVVGDLCFIKYGKNPMSCIVLLDSTFRSFNR